MAKKGTPAAEVAKQRLAGAAARKLASSTPAPDAGGKKASFSGGKAEK